MLVDKPYCPFKADMWYLGWMLNFDMDTNVKGFVEKDTIQTKEIVQEFDEDMGKFNEVTTHIATALPAILNEYTS
ncbi:hypothetical protein EDD85DRAFT_962810 [Armillaria nabsnona]|nr:hypothetical protein EDD85DRAFT_962810 [Armillaria nabsnona]